jgi:hypothetical protein
MPFLALGAIVIWIVDRLAVWMELRGWITYRLTPRVRRGYGMSVMDIEALLQPEKRHVIELKQDGEVYRESDEEAEKRKDRNKIRRQ